MKLASLKPVKVMSNGAQAIVSDTFEKHKKNLVSAKWKCIAYEWALTDRGFFTTNITLDEEVSKKMDKGGGGGAPSEQ